MARWSDTCGNYRINDMTVHPTDYVYALARSNEDIKFGKAQHLKLRFSRLMHKHGDLKILGIAHGYTELERLIHELFSAQRIFNVSTFIDHRGVERIRRARTDWFTPSDDVTWWIAQNMITGDEAERIYRSFMTNNPIPYHTTPQTVTSADDREDAAQEVR